MMHAVRCFLVALLAADFRPAPIASADEGPLGPSGTRGTLVICGGGRLPDPVRKEFVELAGGPNGRLVVIPTARDDATINASLLDAWKACRLAEVSLLHTREPAKANDPDFVAALRRASAVWISGGRQTYLADIYSGTLVEKELHRLLERGGVIGGTSAGAACMSRLMLVRDRIHSVPGWGLFLGAIVDQHFLAKNRRDRLLSALQQHPGHVGFGIDEETALIVRGGTARCLGESTVTILLAPSKDSKESEIILKSGKSLDLAGLHQAALEGSSRRGDDPGIRVPLSR